jgi:tetratricopeptide (TPR) repeat protein
MAAPESGDLKELALPRLLLELQAERFSGAMTLSQGRLEKRFLLDSGAPVSSESSRAGEGLVAQLAASGQISSDQKLRIEGHQKRERVAVARAILELKVLDPKQLFDALREQLRRRLLECFSWADGHFCLDRSFKVPQEARPFRLDVLQTVQDGIESHWSSERVIADLESRMGRYPKGTRALATVAARLQTDDAVEAFLAALDGERTLWQALQEASTPRARAAAWLLDASGAIAYAIRAASASADTSAPPQLEIVVEKGAVSKTTSVPRSAPAKPPDAEREKKAAALLGEVQKIHDQLEDLDCYQLLGVATDAAPGDIKRSYLVAAKNYHPDALSRLGLDADARLQATQVFAEIGKAYATLSNPEARKDYDASLRGEDVGIDAEQLANAEVLFRKGEVMLRLGNFRGALEFLEPAVELWPEEPAYQSALGWAHYKKAPSEPDKALSHLEAAANLDPGDPVVLFRLGTALRATGQEERGATLIDRASSLDPKISR